MKILLSIDGNNNHIELLTHSKPENIEITPLSSNHKGHIIDTDNNIIHFIIEFSDPIIKGIISAWLYDILKGLKGQKKINNIAIDDNLTKDEIENIMDSDLGEDERE